MQNVVEWLYYLAEGAKGFGTAFFEFINYGIEFSIAGTSYSVTVGDILVGPMFFVIITGGIIKWIVDYIIPN